MKIRVTKRARSGGDVYNRGKVLTVPDDIDAKIADKLVARGFAERYEEPTDAGGDGSGQTDLPEPE